MTIQNARDIPLGRNMGNLTDVSGVITGWFQSMVFSKVEKSVVSFSLTETTKEIRTQGVRQPLSPQHLTMKPEGQRAWRWEQIWCTPEIELKVDDVIEFADLRYRVMSRTDWREYGYMYFEIVQDYQEGEAKR